jgi:hypothetical protein
MDYNAWADRAVAFCKEARERLPNCTVDIDIAPPISNAELAELSNSSPLTLPSSLREFWQQVSGRLRAKYSWEVPEERCQPFLKALFPDDPSFSLTYLEGGPNFLSAHEICQWTKNNIELAEDFDLESPLDAEFYRYAVPFLQLRNGDFIGLFVKDEQKDPPAVYLCHELIGASKFIAPSFGEFLGRWEAVNFLWLELLFDFLDRRDFVFNPRSFPDEWLAIQRLFR